MVVDAVLVLRQHATILSVDIPVNSNNKHRLFHEENDSVDHPHSHTLGSNSHCGCAC